MAKNLVYVGIAALAIIAVVLGYKIYQQTTLTTTPPLNQQLQSKSTPQPLVNQATSAATQQSASAAEIAAILNFPSQNATQAEIAKYSETVASVSKNSNTLEITNCTPNPIVLRAAIDTTFTAKNNDTTNHTIYYGGHENIIPAQGEKKLLVKRDFKEGLGLFPYSCDGKGIVGIIAVYKDLR